MHVLMTVNEIGRTAQSCLEGGELALDLGADLLEREPAQQSAAQQWGEASELAVRGVLRHGAERRPGGQIEMEPDADVAAGRQLGGQARPPRPVRHGARRRDPLRPGEVEDGATDALGEAEIIGTENDATC